MGSIHKFSCKCGFEEDVTIGGGMRLQPALIFSTLLRKLWTRAGKYCKGSWLSARLPKMHEPKYS